MYIYIGNDILLEKKYVIGIFSLKYVKNTKEFKSLFNDLVNSNSMIDISEGEPKSFILFKKDNITKGYIAKVSVNTITKRLEKEGR